MPCEKHDLTPFPIINFLFGRWPPPSPLHIKKALASKWYYYNSLALFNNRNDLKEMIGAKGYWYLLTAPKAHLHRLMM